MLAGVAVTHCRHRGRVKDEEQARLRVKETGRALSGAPVFENSSRVEGAGPSVRPPTSSRPRNAGEGDAPSTGEFEDNGLPLNVPERRTRGPSTPPLLPLPLSSPLASASALRAAPDSVPSSAFQRGAVAAPPARDASATSAVREGVIHIDEGEATDNKVGEFSTQSEELNARVGSVRRSSGADEAYIEQFPSGKVALVERIAKDPEMSQEVSSAKLDRIGQLRHRHIVDLLAYRYDPTHPQLATLHMPLGNLEHKLQVRDEQGRSLFSWGKRIVALLEAARGLAFAHSRKPPTVHGHLRTRYIQFGSDWEARIGYFAAAQLWAPESSKTAGYGYTAPEVLNGGKATTESDVYSFGVVMLEVISGMKPLDPNRPPDLHNLVAWARPYLKSKASLPFLVDPALGCNFSRMALFELGPLLAQCLHEDPCQRCSMSHVLEVLVAVQSMAVTEELDRGSNVHEERKAECEVQQTTLDGKAKEQAAEDTTASRPDHTTSNPTAALPSVAHIVAVKLKESAGRDVHEDRSTSADSQEIRKKQLESSNRRTTTNSTNSTAAKAPVSPKLIGDAEKLSRKHPIKYQKAAEQEVEPLSLNPNRLNSTTVKSPKLVSNPLFSQHQDLRADARDLPRRVPELASKRQSRVVLGNLSTSSGKKQEALGARDSYISWRAGIDFYEYPD